MELKVDLIWLGFPENRVRLVLRQAMENLNLLPCWNEYLAGQRNLLPRTYKTIKATSLIVNNRLVYSFTNQFDISPAELSDTIKRHENFPVVKQRLSFKSPLFPAILVAFLPKCPFCFAAYLGFLGITGIELTPYYDWLKYVLVVLVLCMLWLMFQRSKRTKVFTPLYVMAFGCIILLVGKLIFNLALFVNLGIGFILFATLIGIASHHIPFIEIITILRTHLLIKLTHVSKLIRSSILGTKTQNK